MIIDTTYNETPNLHGVKLLLLLALLWSTLKPMAKSRTMKLKNVSVFYRLRLM